MYKYSIILRAYNAEKNVAKSIESVISQTYADWELLIVNDGSTDKTGEICEQYAKQDERIRVIHQENLGCLLSTQTGIRYATGDYVCLIDSDDWYEKDYVEKVDKIVTSQTVDMVVAGYKIVSFGETVKKFLLTRENKMVDAHEAIRIFLETTNYALWNKFVARNKIRYTKEEQEFFEKSGKTTNFGDDLFLLMPVLCECKSVYFLQDALYNYTVEEASISNYTVIDYWGELQNRLRLMEVTYRCICQRNHLDKEIEELIKADTAAVILKSVLGILKTGERNKDVVRELKKNDFYRNIVKRTKFSLIKEKTGGKRAVLMKLFFLLV